MGYWGEAPWENDDAADWFMEVFKKSKLDEIIEKPLSKKVDDFNRDEIRGAITIFIVLYPIFPSKNREVVLDICMKKNRELKKHFDEGGWDEDPDFGRCLDTELELLQRNKNNYGVLSAKRPPIQENLKAWYLKWFD